MSKKIKISVLVYLLSCGTYLSARETHNKLEYNKSSVFSGYCTLDSTKTGFTNSAWKWVNKLIDNINKRQEHNNALIAKYQALLEKKGLSRKQIKKIENKIVNFKNINLMFEQIRDEIAILATSDQIYNVIEDASLNAQSVNDFTEGTAYGQIIYNTQTRMVDIVIPTVDRQLLLFVHELKHAYQFETGTFSFGTENAKYNPFYDQNDELEAYERGVLFGGKFMNANKISYDDIYKKLPIKPVDYTNHPIISMYSSNSDCLQKLSSVIKCVFRINGCTYAPLAPRLDNVNYR